jgi:hypothetical protein
MSTRSVPSRSRNVRFDHSQTNYEHLADVSTDRLRFCKEKIDCCRMMVTRSERYLDFAEDPEGELARYNNYTTRLAGMEKLHVSPDGAAESREIVKRALKVLSDMEDLKGISLQDMVFVHDLFESLSGGFHVSGDSHWFRCKYVGHV